MTNKTNKLKQRLRKQKGKDLISNPDYDDEDDEDLDLDEEDELSNIFASLTALGQRDQQELEDRGILILNQEITKRTLSRISKRMLVLHFNADFTDEIQLILNSPGGYCDAGWALIDLMAFVKNPVKTIAMGEICSMATHIFISGDHRVMSPNCNTMIHQFSDYGEGKYTDLIAKGKIWEMEMDKDINHFIKCSKYNTKEQIRKYILKDQDNWLSPKEMKKHGLCDEIYTPKSKGKK